MCRIEQNLFKSSAVEGRLEHDADSQEANTVPFRQFPQYSYYLDVSVHIFLFVVVNRTHLSL